MDFPALKPTARTLDPGTYPVKTFKAQNGAETRILYGSTRVDTKLNLTYANITDANAELFVTHYDQQQGTFKTFEFKTIGLAFTDGWEGVGVTGNTQETLDRETSGLLYRYESAPVITQVAKGRSTVTVTLIAVASS